MQRIIRRGGRARQARVSRSAAVFGFLHWARSHLPAAITRSLLEDSVSSIRPLPVVRIALLASVAALAGACAPAPEPLTAATRAPNDHASHGRSDGPATMGQRQAAARVLAATARFADIAVAKAEGYSVQHPAGCAASPDGGQGFHWLNESLVDGKTELLKPELVMYEPQADGSMELVGVDYIIPFAQWKAPQPPVLLGREFMRNEPLGVWALHIWAPRDNPSGLFAPWNPTVSCAHAAK